MTISSPMTPEGDNRANLAIFIAKKILIAVTLGALVGVVALAGIVASAGRASAAAEKGAVTPDQVAGTVHVCSSCHGVGGRSVSPTFPRLAGQQKDYLVAQLKAFRGKTRADPHAQTYMWGMAAHLSDAMIDGIATYYSTQPPVPGVPATSPEITAGAKIFSEGIPSEKVPACNGCHGPKAAGIGPIPRLAGQHRDYIVRQLHAFASNARANEVMHQNSVGLTSEQINEVSAFLATQ